MRYLLLVLLLLAGCGGGASGLTLSSPAPGVLAATWTAPTKFVDGTTIPPGAIAGYRVAYGTSETALSQTFMVAGTSAQLTGLTIGTRYYVTVRTVGADGDTSAPAGPVSAVAR